MTSFSSFHSIQRRNYLINGNFSIWQRGTSFTASVVTSDLWSNAHGGDCTKTASRGSFTVGQTDVPGNPRYFFRTVVSTTGSSASTYCQLFQSIESVQSLSGRKLTLSFWAKADSNKDMGIRFVQSFGTGGSSAVDGIGTTTVSLTSSWKKYIVNIDIPSISGKVIGTSETDGLVLAFAFSAGSTYTTNMGVGLQSGTFDIAQVQVEEGNEATPFEDRHIGIEILLCQRYYCKSYALTTNPGTVTTAGEFYRSFDNAPNTTFTIYTTWQFPVRMRNTPTVTVYSPVTGASNTVRINSSEITPSSITTSDYSMYIIVVGSVASSIRSLRFHATAAAA